MANTYTFTGPASLTIYQSGLYTITPSLVLQSGVTDIVSLSGSISGGTFVPTSLSFTSGTLAKTFNCSVNLITTLTLIATSASGYTVTGSPLALSTIADRTHLNYYRAVAGSKVQNVGGAVLGVSSGSLQNTRLFDNDYGWPYLGIHNAYNENKPVVGSTVNGVAKSLSSGKFAAMVQDQYIMLGFTNQIAGVANTLLRSPGLGSNGASQNLANLWRNTWLKRTTGGWYYQSGFPVNAQYSRDKISTEVNPTYSSPGRLTYMQGALTALSQSYKARTD